MELIPRKILLTDVGQTFHGEEGGTLHVKKIYPFMVYAENAKGNGRYVTLGELVQKGLEPISVDPFDSMAKRANKRKEEV